MRFQRFLDERHARRCGANRGRDGRHVFLGGLDRLDRPVELEGRAHVRRILLFEIGHDHGERQSRDLRSELEERGIIDLKGTGPMNTWFLTGRSDLGRRG